MVFMIRKYINKLEMNEGHEFLHLQCTGGGQTQQDSLSYMDMGDIVCLPSPHFDVRTWK